MDRLGAQRVEATAHRLRHHGKVGAMGGLGDHVARIALFIDIAHGHRRRIAQPPERGFDPLAHQPAGLALRFEDLRPDIGGTFAEPDRHERRRRHVDTDQLGLELLRQPTGTFDARIILRVVLQLEQNRADRA